MVGKALVDADYVQGRLLVGKLLENDFPIDVAAWRFDETLGEWELLIASPQYEQLPPSHSYREVQRALGSADIDLPLSRVHLVGGSSRLVSNLRAIANSSSGTDRVVLLAPFSEEDPSASFQVYGRTALDFEREVFAALQRVQMGAQILRSDFFDPSTGRESDFVLDDGENTIVIEVKARAKPLGLAEVHQQAGAYLDLKSRWQRPLDMLLVSRSGFTDQAKTWVTLDRPPRLVDWTAADPTDALRIALRSVWSRFGRPVESGQAERPSN